MTLTEVATAAHVSQAAVSKNKKVNRIKNPDGTLFFDPADKTVQTFLNRHSGKQKPPKPPKSTEKRYQQEEKPPETPISRPIPAPQTTNSDPDDDLDDELKREKILTSKQNRAIRSRELVPREDVKQAFMRFYGVHTSILPALSTTTGGNICDELGITDVPRRTRVTEILDIAIYSALEEMKDVMTRQLRGIGADK